MLRAFSHPIPERRAPLPATVESALWAAGAITATLLAIVILFFGIFMSRAG